MIFENYFEIIFLICCLNLTKPKYKPRFSNIALANHDDDQFLVAIFTSVFHLFNFLIFGFLFQCLLLIKSQI
jgi:hypothetical protein